MFKVLLYSPITNYKKYVLPEYIKHTDRIISFCKSLGIQIDRLLIDNSQDINFHKEFPDTIYLREGENIREIMCNCDNYARQKVLDDNYTHLFKLECDLFPPENIIPRLIMHEVPVVGLGYFIGFGDECRFLQSDIDMGRHRFSLQMQNRASFLRYNGKLQPATQFGTGCILIRGDIFRIIKFRVNPDDDIHADSNFHYDLFMNNIVAYLDTAIIPYHFNSDWNLIYSKEKVV